MRWQPRSRGWTSYAGWRRTGRSSFTARRADEPRSGVMDTAHLVSHEPVRPLARLDVTPDDFPFAGRIRYYRDGEPSWVSLLRA